MTYSAYGPLMLALFLLAWGVEGAGQVMASQSGPGAALAAEPVGEGCGGQTECKPVPQPEAVTGVAHPADLPPLTLTAQGVGGLSGQIAFTLEALQKALPGLQLSKAERHVEGMIEVVFHGLKDGRPALVIGGEQLIDSINVVGVDVSGPGGVRIGETLAQIRQKVTLDECYRGVEAEADKVVCSEKGGNIGYWFAHPLPRKREPDVLQPDMLPKSAALISMFWYRMN